VAAAGSLATWAAVALAVATVVVADTANRLLPRCRLSAAVR
jgi:hypothetical protein